MRTSQLLPWSAITTHGSHSKEHDCVDFPTVLLVDICDRAWLAFAGDSKVWESLEEQARRDAAEAEA